MTFTTGPERDAAQALARFSSSEGPDSAEDSQSCTEPLCFRSWALLEGCVLSTRWHSEAG